PVLRHPARSGDRALPPRHQPVHPEVGPDRRSGGRCVRLPASEHGSGAYGEAPPAPHPAVAPRRARPAGGERRSRSRSRPGHSARGRGAGVRAPGALGRAAADQSRAARRQRPRRCAAQSRRAHRRGRPVVAGRDADPDGQVRHQRRPLAARPLRDAAHEAPAARRGGRRQDGREDGVPAGVLHLPGDLGGDHRPGRDQVRRGALPAGGESEMSASLSHPERLTPPPPVPHTLADLGLPTERVEQLIVKTLFAGELTGLEMAERMRVAYDIFEPLIVRLRTEQIIEVRGASAASSSSYRYALTDLGRSRALQYLEINLYTGAMPVPLGAYVAQLKSLQASRGFIDRERLRKGFSHLVIGDQVLEKLGPAVNANKARFLYGPPGNGKTVIAEGLGRTIGGDMYMPYAIDVDGHIITMYDPINHDRLDADEPDTTSIIAAAPSDRRWVRIRRPVLMVDDFGRQRIRPDELLNRWIVPLESRVDFLTLHTGKKFEVPFDVLTVFATNLDPA